jgi:hypothetical protein
MTRLKLDLSLVLCVAGGLRSEFAGRRIQTLTSCLHRMSSLPFTMLVTKAVLCVAGGLRLEFTWGRPDPLLLPFIHPLPAFSILPPLFYLGLCSSSPLYCSEENLTQDLNVVIFFCGHLTRAVFLFSNPPSCWTSSVRLGGESFSSLQLRCKYVLKLFIKSKVFEDLWDLRLIYVVKSISISFCTFSFKAI